MVDIRGLSDETKKSIVKTVNALKYAAGFSGGEIENYVLNGAMPEIVYDALNKVLNEKLLDEIMEAQKKRENKLKGSAFTAEQMIEVTTAIYEAKLQNQSAKNAATVKKINDPGVVSLVNETKSHLTGFIDNANRALATLKSKKQNSSLSTKELEVLKKDITNLGSMILAAKKSYVILNAVAVYKDKFANVLTPVEEFITKGDLTRLNESLKIFNTTNSSLDPAQKAEAYAKGKSIQTFLNSLSNSGTISKLNKIKSGADEINKQLKDLNKRQTELESNQNKTNSELQKIVAEQERIKTVEGTTKQDIDALKQKQQEYEEDKATLAGDLRKVQEQLKNATGYLNSANSDIMDIKAKQTEQENKLNENQKQLEQAEAKQDKFDTKLSDIELKQQNNVTKLNKLDTKFVELDKTYKQDKQQLREELRKVEDDNVAAREEIEKKIANLDKQHEKDKNNILEDISEINQEQQELRNEQKETKAAIRLNKSLIEDLEEANEEIIENQNALKEKFAELKAKQRASENDINQLKEDSAEIIEEQEKLTESVNGIVSEIKENNKKLEDISKANAELIKKQDELKSTYEKDKEELSKTLTKIDTTLTDYEKALAEIKESQAKAKEERERTNAKVESHDAKIEGHDAIVAEQQRKIIELENELSTLKNQVQGIVAGIEQTPPVVTPIPPDNGQDDAPAEGDNSNPTPPNGGSGAENGNNGNGGQPEQGTPSTPENPPREPINPPDGNDGESGDGTETPPAGGGNSGGGNGGTGRGATPFNPAQPYDPIDPDPVEVGPETADNSGRGESEPERTETERNQNNGGEAQDESVPGGVKTAKTRKLSVGRKFINFLGRHWLLAATILGAVGLTAAAFLGPAGAGAALSVAHFAVYNIVTFGAIGLGALGVKYFAFRKRRQANAAQSHFLNRERKVQRRIRKSDKNLAKIKSLQSQIDNLKSLASEAKTGSFKYRRLQSQIKKLRKQQFAIDEKNVALLTDINKEFAPVKNRAALNPMNLVYRTKAMFGAARLNEYHNEHAKFIDKRATKKPSKETKLTEMKLNGNLTDEDLNYQITKRKYYENLKERIEELKQEPKRKFDLKQLEKYSDILKSDVVPKKSKDRYDERAEERKILGVVAKDIVKNQDAETTPVMKGAERKELSIFTNAKESTASNPNGNYTGESAIVVTLPNGTKRKYGSAVGQRYIDISQRAADGIPPTRDEGRSR